MAGKTTEWILKLTDKVSGGLKSITSQATNAAQKTAALQGHLDNLQERSGMLQRTLGKMLIAGGVFAFLTYGGLKFDQGMAKINATAQLTNEQLAITKDRLVDIGSESGGNFARVPDAFEKILSQVSDTNLSFEILEASVDGAKTGFADIDVVSGALANSLSLIGKENATAREVLDTFITAKDLGGGEFEDFAQYIPQLLAAGKNLGLGYKDVAGTFSFMTAKGIEASQATMFIQNAFSALSKNDIIKGLKKGGIQLFDKDGNLRNIGLIFADLQGKLEGMTDQQKTNFFDNIGLRDVQAKNAFAILASDSEKLNAILNGTANSLGATDRSLGFTKNRLTEASNTTDRFRANVIRLVESMNPFIDFTMRAANWLLELTSNFIKANPKLSGTIVVVSAMAFAIAGFILVISLATTRWNIMMTQIALGQGPLAFFIRGFKAASLAVWGFIRATTIATWNLLKNALGFAATGLAAIGSFVVGLVAATAAQWGLNIAMNANPIGLILIGILAVGSAIYLMIEYWDEVKQFLIETAKFLLNLNPFTWLFKMLYEVFPEFRIWVDDIFESIIGWIGDLWDSLIGVFNYVKDFLGLGDSTSIDINTNTSASRDSTKKDPLSALNLSGSGSGSSSSESASFASSGEGKSVTMNLTINQQFSVDENSDFSKVKNKTLEAIVAAGRDGMALG